MDWQMQLRTVLSQDLSLAPHAMVPGLGAFPSPITSQLYVGDSGNNNFIGTANDDTFLMTDGGNDTVTGNGGNDSFSFGATLDNNDRVYGGTGDDELSLFNADYDLTLNSGTVTSIENVVFGAGHNYYIDPSDDFADTFLFIDATQLGAANYVYWDGNQETDVQMQFDGGAGNDIVTGGYKDDTISGWNGNDLIALWRGGNDSAYGGNGDDTIRFYDKFTPDDYVDGGAGYDTVMLQGGYNLDLRSGDVLDR